MCDSKDDGVSQSQSQHKIGNDGKNHDVEPNLTSGSDEEEEDVEEEDVEQSVKPTLFMIDPALLLNRKFLSLNPFLQ